MFYFFLTEILLVIGFFLAIIIDFFLKSTWSAREKLNLQLLFIFFYLIFILIYLISTLNIGTVIYWGSFYQTDSIHVVKIILVIFTLFWVLLIKEIYLRRYPIFSLYPSLILVFLLTNFLIVIQLNLFGIFICLEIQNILLFAFLSLNIRDLVNYKQVFHYFLLSSFISGIMAMGCALIYISSGTLDLIYLKHCLPYLKTDYYFLLGTFFVLLGFLFKLGLFPFFYWIPAIFRTAPLSGLFASAIISKFVYFFILLSNLQFLFTFYENIIVFSGVISVVLCSFLAIKEFTIRGVLGYSSVIQTSFLVFGIPFSSSHLNASVFFFLIIYCVVMFFILFCLMVLERRKSKAKIIYIHDLRSIGTVNFMFAFCFSMAIFSLAGLPPFPGFFGKLYLVLNLWETDHFFLSAFIIIYTLFTMLYYIRFINLMFSGTAADIPEEKNGEFIYSNLTIFILSFFIAFNVWFFTNHLTIWAFSLFCITFV